MQGLMIQPFLKYLSLEKRYSSHTLIAYQRDLEQLQDHLKNEFEISAFDEVKHVHLRDWIVQLTDSNLSPASVNRKIATLKSFYKFLVAREYLEINPAEGLKLLKTNRKLPSFVKESEIHLLFDSIEYGPAFKDQRDKLLLQLFYGTGVRLAELKNLRETDINFYENTIKVLGKGNKERILPVSNSLIQLIKAYLNLKKAEGMESIFLLITDTGKPLYPMFIYRKVKYYLSLITTQSKKGPHVLRHTFATHLLNKGADLNAVKDLLGHTSLAATQVYTHNSIEKLKEVFNQAHPKA